MEKTKQLICKMLSKSFTQEKSEKIADISLRCATDVTVVSLPEDFNIMVVTKDVGPDGEQSIDHPDSDKLLKLIDSFNSVGKKVNGYFLVKKERPDDNFVVLADFWTTSALSSVVLHALALRVWQRILIPNSDIPSKAMLAKFADINLVETVTFRGKERQASSCHPDVLSMELDEDFVHFSSVENHPLKQINVMARSDDHARFAESTHNFLQSSTEKARLHSSALDAMMKTVKEGGKFAHPSSVIRSIMGYKTSKTR